MFKKTSKEVTLFFIILAMVSLGLGFSDKIFSNYFREVYNIDGFTRGLIEFPRELPGLLCIFAVTLLSAKSDIKIAMIAQVLCAAGLLVLGFITPTFGIMLIFLFINSMGMHLFFPLQDGIGVALAEKDKMGTRMGQYKGVSIAFSMLSSLIVYIGFKVGFFSFETPIKIILILGAIFSVIAFFLLSYLNKMVTVEHKKMTKIVFKKRYKNYYWLAILNGVQKQIMYVFGPWVLIELLNKRADFLAILVLIGSFLGIFFTPLVGKLTDKLGIKKMLYVDALSYIFVYLGYGIMTWGFVSGNFTLFGIPLMVVSLFYILDSMSMQVGMVKIVYLHSILEQPADMTPTLSLGISLDHILSISSGILGGLIWQNIGAHYVFFIAALLSFFNLIIAHRVEEGENAAA